MPEEILSITNFAKGMESFSTDPKSIFMCSNFVWRGTHLATMPRKREIKTTQVTGATFPAHASALLPFRNLGIYEGLLNNPSQEPKLLIFGADDDDGIVYRQVSASTELDEGDAEIEITPILIGEDILGENTDGIPKNAFMRWFDEMIIGEHRWSGATAPPDDDFYFIQQIPDGETDPAGDLIVVTNLALDQTHKGGYIHITNPFNQITQIYIDANDAVGLGGTWQIAVGGTALAFDADKAAVQAAFDAAYGALNTKVYGGPFPDGKPFFVEWIGDYAGEEVIYETPYENFRYNGFTMGHTFNIGDLVWDDSNIDIDDIMVYQCATGHVKGPATSPPGDGTSNANWTYVSTAERVRPRSYLEIGFDTAREYGEQIIRIEEVISSTVARLQYSLPFANPEIQYSIAPNRMYNAEEGEVFTKYQMREGQAMVGTYKSTASSKNIARGVSLGSIRAVHKGRVFWVGGLGLQWGPLPIPEELSYYYNERGGANAYVRIESSFEEEILDIVSYNSELFIFLPSQVKILRGDVSIQNQQLGARIDTLSFGDFFGCSSRAWVTEMGLTWVDKNGHVIVYNGISVSNISKDRLYPFFLSDSFDFSGADSWIAGLSGRVVLSTVATQNPVDGLSHFMVYDIARDAWTGQGGAYAGDDTVHLLTSPPVIYKGYELSTYQYEGLTDAITSLVDWSTDIKDWEGEYSPVVAPSRCQIVVANCALSAENPMQPVKLEYLRTSFMIRQTKSGNVEMTYPRYLEYNDFFYKDVYGKQSFKGLTAGDDVLDHAVYFPYVGEVNKNYPGPVYYGGAGLDGIADKTKSIEPKRITVVFENPQTCLEIHALELAMAHSEDWS